MSKHICPNCSFEINLDKEKLITCYKCHAKLLLVKINNKNQLYDVTPKEEVQK